VDYLPRVVDASLRELLQGSKAISIEGPRAVGKTLTASRVTTSVVRLDNPDTRLIVAADRRQHLEELDPPVLIDEWQLDPPIWDTVRRMVDDDPQPGRFVLTGSANPRDTRLHSGAGRFLRLRMRPLSFAERETEVPTVSLAALWNGEGKVRGRTSVSLRQYADEIVNSGLPGIRSEPPRIRTAALDDYLGYAIEHEVPELGGVRRRPDSLRTWLRAYAAASSGTASFQAIAAAVDREALPSRSTITDYRDALSRLWLLDEVPAWQPGRPRLNQLGSAPKHHLADPALAASLLTTNADRLVAAGGLGDDDAGLRGLRDGPMLGALFESLVTLSIRTYADALGLETAHLRTHRGDREIDLILHSGDGRVLAVEVKLAAAADDKDARHLNWLHEQLGDGLVDRIVVTTGERAYRRSDGVAVVPLALLGP
jgi:predicted AAA+ superfamily ATPase